MLYLYSCINNVYCFSLMMFRSCVLYVTLYDMFLFAKLWKLFWMWRMFRISLGMAVREVWGAENESKVCFMVLEFLLMNCPSLFAFIFLGKQRPSGSNELLKICFEEEKKKVEVLKSLLSVGKIEVEWIKSAAAAIPYKKGMSFIWEMRKCGKGCWLCLLKTLFEISFSLEI